MFASCIEFGLNGEEDGEEDGPFHMPYFAH